MRIVLVSPHLPPKTDAVGDFTDRLAQEYLRRGDEVLVLTDDASHVERRYATASVGRSFDSFAGARAMKYVEDFRPDAAVVQYTPFLHGPASWFTPFFVKRLRRAEIPVGIYAHELFYPAGSVAVRGRLKHRYLVWRDAISLRWADVVFVPNEDRRKRLLAHLPSARVAIVPIGSNLEPPMVAPRRTPVSPFRLMAFGVIMPRRRLELMIDAIALLRVSGIEATLSVAGRVWDEAYASATRARCEERGVTQQVQFLGKLTSDELTAVFDSHDLFLHAAAEGAIASAGSLLAALAHGIPVLAARTRYDDAHFDGAIAFFDGGAEALAREAGSLLLDEKRMQELAVASRLLYENTFGWRRLTDALNAALLPATPYAAL
jgi:glycosyltransferase involved in cell wall biosynthesis